MKYFSVHFHIFIWSSRKHCFNFFKFLCSSTPSQF